MLELTGSWWHLTLIFALEGYFRIFLAQAIPFEWLYLATLFLVWYYVTILGHGLISRSWVQGQGHGSAKDVACNSETTGWKLLGLDRNIRCDDTRK